MSSFTLLGEGTLKLGPTETATDFAGEVLGAKVTHAYNEIGAARTMLDGTVRPSSRIRNDGFTASCENDLTAAGLYKYVQDNDLTEVPLEFVPNTPAGAKWTGSVVLTLPADVGADQFGNPIVSEIAWEAVGKLTFTPATA